MKNSHTIQSVAVYLGSRTGNNPKHLENARKMGTLLAGASLRTVYGGSSVGCMQALCDGVLECDGDIIGVFPEGFLGNSENVAENRDVSPKGVPNVVLTKDLTERIEIMEELSDAAIVLPGSFGSLNELFSHTQGWPLGYHSKPLLILNTDGYYNGLKLQIDTMVSEGFMNDSNRADLYFFETPEQILQKILQL